MLNNEPPPAAAAAGERRSVGTPGGSKRPRRLSEKGLSKEPWTEDALRKVLEGDGERVGLLDQLQQTAGSDVRFRQLIGGLFGHAAVQQEIKALELPTMAEQVVAWGVRDHLKAQRAQHVHKDYDGRIAHNAIMSAALSGIDAATKGGGPVTKSAVAEMELHCQASARCFFSVGGAAGEEGLAGGRAHAPGRMARGRRLHGVAFHGEQGAVVGRQDQRSCLRRARWLSPPPLSQALLFSVERSVGRSSGRTRAAPAMRWSRTRPASVATVCTSGCRRSAPTQPGDSQGLPMVLLCSCWCCWCWRWRTSCWSRRCHAAVWLS